jgi:hypothetical protein
MSTEFFYGLIANIEKNNLDENFLNYFVSG